MLIELIYLYEFNKILNKIRENPIVRFKFMDLHLLSLNL